VFFMCVSEMLCGRSIERLSSLQLTSLPPSNYCRDDLFCNVMFCSVLR
jgi:hypothetical protein